jgi:hypothetical protein
VGNVIDEAKSKFLSVTIPERDRMQATALQVWQDGNQKWNEFTVFMIFGQIKDFNAGAYGIAEFSAAGLSGFQINETPLVMLDLDAKPHADVQVAFPSVEQVTETTWPDPGRLRAGQAFTVSKETPLMPEIEPADEFAAILLMKQVPKGGAFKISESRKRDSSTWYHVTAIDQNKKKIGSGWINSTALLGQELEPFK